MESGKSFLAYLYARTICWYCINYVFILPSRTDATIATHITTIQERSYATKDGQKFLPTKLGIALIEGYNR
jgi:hypothetical protein